MSLAFEKSNNNPCGLNGVEFIEYTGPSSGYYAKLLMGYGFTHVASAGEKSIHLYRQNKINFIVNLEKGTFANDFERKHKQSICSTGFRVVDSAAAHAAALDRGARPFKGSDAEKGACPFPAIYGIGDSLIYFVDEKNRKELYEKIFKTSMGPGPAGFGLNEIDHFTNNVPVGEMDKWTEFYVKTFNFREIRYFDIRGKSTGLLSRALASPCGQFAVPINEPTDPKSQIQEYLDEYKGSGIQHVALSSDNIVTSLEALRAKDNEFLKPPPGTYYRSLKDRLPNVIEKIDILQNQAILVDGDHHGYLLQIFSKNIIGPIFFEIIQRRNHGGFGEGNFQALFDSIEQDQRERGFLK